ncbi:MAG: hypothetical protein QG575_1393 [Euryarchaeota archaeon]|nr:hypothetical protein [Euryarchaeota archaeon]
MSKIWIIVAIAILLTLNCVSAGMVSLTYDDGGVEDAAWIDEHRGHGVVFTAPTDNWSLSQVAILGKLVAPSESEMFVIEVWDQNLSLLYKITDKASAYFDDNLTWSLVDLPDVRVSGDFLIAFFEFAGVWQGVDTSPSSGRSVLVSRNPNRILNWSVQNSTQNQTNWMIQAVGHSPEPNLTIAVISDAASVKSPSKIKVMATDPDGNLKSATQYVVDNKTREIVWARVVEMTGSSAEVEFSWPAAMFRISANGQDEGALFAINNPGVVANLSSLLTYSAPCIIELNKSVNFTAEAYFGEDGQLNALIDSYGFSHYLSQDVLNITDPGKDYEKYAKDNITIIKGTSKIGFINMKVPARQDEPASEITGPIVFSSSPSSHYDLRLLRSNAGMGEYMAVVKVEDQAFNALSNIAGKTIKVK